MAVNSLLDNERVFLIAVMGLGEGSAMSIQDLRSQFYADPPDFGGSAFDPEADQNITGLYAFSQPPVIPDATEENQPASLGQLTELSDQINSAWDAGLTADFNVHTDSVTLTDITGLALTIPADSLRDRYISFNWSLKYQANTTNDLKAGLTVSGAGVEWFASGVGIAVGATGPTGTGRVDTMSSDGAATSNSFQMPGQGDGVTTSYLIQGELFIPKTVACTIQCQAAPTASGGTASVIKRLTAIHAAVWKLV